MHNSQGQTTCSAKGTKCAQQGCANDGNACIYDSECCTTGATCTGGVCTPPSRQCVAPGATCSANGDCCQGTCIRRGNISQVCACGDPDHPFAGCTCNGGTQGECGAGGLICCASSGTPGGPGTCTSQDSCKPSQCAAGGETCKQGSDCCSGKCNTDGICYCTDPARPGSGCACTTGTQNPCGDTSLVCCASTSRAGGPGVCTSGSVGCGGVVLPNPGSGAATASGRDWVGPAALIGAGAAFVASRLRRTVAPDSE